MIKINAENLFEPPRTYAVKFIEQDKARGPYLLFCRGNQGVCLRGQIFVIREDDLHLLEHAGLSYESVEVWTTDAREILRYFGVEEVNHSYRNKHDEPTQLRFPFD